MREFVLLLGCVVVWVASIEGVAAQEGQEVPEVLEVAEVPEAPESQGASSDLKLYVFDCGQISLTDVSAFGLSNDETAVRDLFVPCYLIQHGEETLLWDTGLPSSVADNPAGVDVQGMHLSYAKPFLEQLSEAGFSPQDIDFLALSHMHFDHSSGANDFSGSTLLIQQPEYQAAFPDVEQYSFFDKRWYAALENSEKRLLNGEYDVFGDGSVVIYSAPGHTPGHQVLYLNLTSTGPVVLSGDLYHFRFSREHQRVPVFNYDKAETLNSMRYVEALLKEKHATLWIEHDKAFADTLTKAPFYYH